MVGGVTLNVVAAIAAAWPLVFGPPTGFNQPPGAGQFSELQTNDAFTVAFTVSSVLAIVGFVIAKRNRKVILEIHRAPRRRPDEPRSVIFGRIGGFANRDAEYAQLWEWREWLTRQEQAAHAPQPDQAARHGSSCAYNCGCRALAAARLAESGEQGLILVSPASTSSLPDYLTVCRPTSVTIVTLPVLPASESEESLPMYSELGLE